MYSSLDNLKKRLRKFYVELYATDVADVADDDAATADLAAAAAELDGAIGNRYLVPVSAAAALPLLSDWNLTLAEERAWSRGETTDIPAKVKDRVAEVRKRLIEVKDGAFKLAAAETAAGLGGAAIIAGPDPLFTREQLKGF